MTASEKYNTVKRACTEQKVCQVKFRDEQAPRYIHPFGICLTFSRGIVIVCLQEEQEESGRRQDATGPDVTNLPMEDCDHIHITERKFEVIREFIQNSICDDWLFHIKIA